MITYIEKYKKVTEVLTITCDVCGKVFEAAECEGFIQKGCADVCKECQQADKVYIQKNVLGQWKDVLQVHKDDGENVRYCMQDMEPGQMYRVKEPVQGENNG